MRPRRALAAGAWGRDGVVVARAMFMIAGVLLAAVVFGLFYALHGSGSVIGKLVVFVLPTLIAALVLIWLGVRRMRGQSGHSASKQEMYNYYRDLKLQAMKDHSARGEDKGPHGK